MFSWWKKATLHGSKLVRKKIEKGPLKKQVEGLDYWDVRSLAVTVWKIQSFLVRVGVECVN